MNLVSEKSVLDVNSFTLSLSDDIHKAVLDILKIVGKSTLIHIISYDNNNSLAKDIKTELNKKIPKAKIVLLNHNGKAHISLVVYSLKEEYSISDISDYIIRKLEIKNSLNDKRLDDYRNKLLSRYFVDHLTNLPNMYQLRKDLYDNESGGLIIINIDNFKTINNFYGFIVGDFVIEEVGKFLKSNVKDHKIYKLSADEFAIILKNNMGFYDLKDYLSKLYETVKSIIIKYQDINIYVDLTLASCANTKNSEMFSKVSMALKYAKEKRLPFWIYEERMHFENDYERNLLLSGLVRSAIENFKIIPYFQPIINNKTMKVEKYECLARLIDENGKILSPFVFIPIAKKIKAYKFITKIIIDKSFEAFENNTKEFTINLSIEDIMNSEIFKFIIDKLKNTLASNRVTFELLESEAIQDFKKVERFITEVKRFGAKIAIDDFGSGYSNFSYLTKINIDYIKIDGSLIKDIDVNKNSHLVVETIVEFSKKLEIKTIAEFVHSSTVLDKVKELGIEYSQGFYIDEPLEKIREESQS